ncbi:hypothetical protein A374_04459 [Fictibacillus macauensis ZFHKF-1]|uniref:Cysteine dioxygenase n=1 Tax=Fictibacillus macauensis ZFHKF-1 TaxID=1196324 RepID=I8J4T1_9BACL|nr:cysteine dioxygenase family protein [Fictibacillus macauensis]EIT86796.1 hypothetical protein A374_04459 [Fictibacillus macauensis ZFHKF-1]
MSSFLERVHTHFSFTTYPTSEQLRDALHDLQATKADVQPFLQAPEHYPYGRKMIYKTPWLEMLVMHWSKTIDCAPHDHGQSYGWVQLLSGQSSHTLYRVDQQGQPQAIKEKIEPTGSSLRVTNQLVHKMGTAGEEPLITLHVYAPPVSGMKVYDLPKCAVCIVADDCGAWWPEDQRQIVQEMRYSSTRIER